MSEKIKNYHKFEAVVTVNEDRTSYGNRLYLRREAEMKLFLS